MEKKSDVLIGHRVMTDLEKFYNLFKGKHHYRELLQRKVRYKRENVEPYFKLIQFRHWF